MRAETVKPTTAEKLLDLKTSRIVFIVASAFLAVVLIVLGAVLLHQDMDAYGKFPADVKIAGVSVAGLTTDQAVAKCEKALAKASATPLALKVDSEVYQITPQEVGLRIDYKASVNNAYEEAWGVNLVERLGRRFFKSPRAMDLPLVIRYDKQKVSDFVTRAMPSINCEPHDAYVDVSAANAHIVPGRDGRKADFKEVLAATESALRLNRRTVDVPLVSRTPPKEKDVGFGKYIVVNIAEHTLSLYERDTLLARYPVATGSKEWPTCIGEWAVVKAEKNPTWYNRGSAWAENMPASLPPGPNNPLGTRAITINGGGVLIHGTNDTGSIGYSASHGCVRMYMRDVEALFEHVYIGMPVFIIKRTGEPGYEYTKKAFWK